MARGTNHGQAIETNSRANLAQTGEGRAGDHIAQFGPPVVSDRRTITVTGYGLVTVPADQAKVRLFFAPWNPYQPPEEPPEGRTLAEADLQPVIDALIEASVSADAIDVYLSPIGDGPFGQQGNQIRFDLDQPSRERVQQIVSTVSAVDEENDGFALTGIGVNYILDECTSAENDTRRAAMRDAQEQVQAFANTAGIRVGEIVSISGFPYRGFETCPSESLFTYEQIRPYDPSAPAEARVFTQISVTYELLE
jgi:uncharacterized protein YggE